MSGGYDNRIVRGPNDNLIDAGFAGNNMVAATLNSSTLTLFNLFGGNSFYLNAVTILIRADTTGTNGGIQLLQGPNPGNLVGATTLFVTSTGIGASAINAITEVLFQASNLGYRNRSGANAYLHAMYQSPITAGGFDVFVVGGPTSLLS